MTHYRLYLVGRDGHYVGVEDLDHPDDETAIAFQGTEKRAGKPETPISGTWPECFLVFQDQDYADRLCQALIRASKLTNNRKD